jgi:hypothetical protein
MSSGRVRRKKRQRKVAAGRAASIMATLLWAPRAMTSWGAHRTSIGKPACAFTLLNSLASSLIKTKKQTHTPGARRWLRRRGRPNSNLLNSSESVAKGAVL